MMYPFLTLDDNTEIVHSEMHKDGTVKVYIEKPDAKDCFHHATCYLPGYRWEDIFGFSNDEIAKYQEIIESTAHLILQFAQEGGFDNAAGVRKILLAGGARHPRQHLWRWRRGLHSLLLCVQRRNSQKSLGENCCFRNEIQKPEQRKISARSLA